MDKITLRLYAQDLTVLLDLFNTTTPASNSRVVIDGIGDIEFGRISHHLGISTQDIVITLIINVIAGVPSSLLANWIFHKLSRDGQTPVRIGNDPVVKTSEEEIASTLTTQK